MHLFQAEPEVSVVLSKAIPVVDPVTCKTGRSIDPLLGDDPGVEGCHWEDGVECWDGEGDRSDGDGII